MLRSLLPILLGVTTAFAASAADVVYTRGEFRGTSRHDGHDYAHIKIVVGSKLPFSTLAYRIADVAVPGDIAKGMKVEFRAERVGRDNVLVEIRRASP
ncbi:hypothetical protein [Ramlibacter sp.]|uniref:hypothetical protein n=1 Tax=Ramlibacter sp. TaxID=1917967 RepID=UPI003D0FB8BF